MTDRLLRKQEIAAILGTSPDVAASVLAKNGCKPIDFGRGRSRGPRWLESAVNATLYSMQSNANTKKHRNPQKKENIQQPQTDKPVADMNINELAKLVTKQSLPECKVVQ